MCLCARACRCACTFGDDNDIPYVIVIDNRVATFVNVPYRRQRAVSLLMYWLATI